MRWMPGSGPEAQGLERHAPRIARLKKPLLPVPGGGTGDAFSSADTRRITQALSCARDVEFTMVREERHTPSMQRRVDAQWNACQFAQRAGGICRPYRQAPSRRRNAQRPRDHAADFVEGGCVRAGEDEHLTDGLFARTT